MNAFAFSCRSQVSSRGVIGGRKHWPSRRELQMPSRQSRGRGRTSQKKPATGPARRCRTAAGLPSPLALLRPYRGWRSPFLSLHAPRAPPPRFTVATGRSRWPLVTTVPSPLAAEEISKRVIVHDHRILLSPAGALAHRRTDEPCPYRFDWGGGTSPVETASQHGGTSSLRTGPPLHSRQWGACLQ